MELSAKGGRVSVCVTGEGESGRICVVLLVKEALATQLTHLRNSENLEF